MSKEHGLGAGYFFGGVDLSGDSASFEKISKSQKLIPSTGVDKHAKENLPGQSDGSIGWTSHFNPDNAHAVLSTLPRTDRIASYFHKQNVRGTPVASLVSKQENYDPQRANTGALQFKTSTLGNAYWLDWGSSLTVGKATHASASTAETGVDIWGAGFAFGLQAYLHVFSIGSGTATIKLQGSSDNGGADAYADITGGTFASVSSGPQAQRLETTRTLAVERWTKVVTTGVFTNLVFAVAVTINRTLYPL